MAAIVIILTLALGIGANVAVFSVASALLLRPMPVPHPEQLVRLFGGDATPSFGIFSYANYLDLRDHSTSFTGLAAHQNVPASVSIDGVAENMNGELVTGNYFTVMGAAASIGRTLLPADDERMEQGAVAVISDSLWRRRFGSDPAATGRKLSVNGHVFSVAGVMPASFHGSHSAFQTDFWAPMSTHEMVRPRGLDIMRRGWGWLHGTGRLKSGITVAQAQAEIDQLTAALKRQYPDSNSGLHFWLYRATALPEDLSENLRKALAFLALVAIAVQLVACANVAGILLSRFFARGQEIAVRHSLGANRIRLMSQHLMESIILALMGGVAGIAISVWVRDGLRLLMPPDWPTMAADFTLDGSTLLYALAISLATGILSAAAPLIRIRSMDLNSVLREESFSGRKHSRFFGIFVGGQVAICTLLLVVAGLLLRTMDRSLSFDPGFNTRNMILGTIDLNRQGFTEERGREFFRTLSQNLSSMPGISSVSYSVVTPLGAGDEAMMYAIPGHTPPNGDQGFLISNNIVGPRYFETMGIPIVLGRTFDFREEKQGSIPAVVINETMARLYWGNENPVGKTIQLVGEAPQQIIGVARDIKYYSLGESPLPYVYRSFGQAYLYPVTVDVRTSVDARTLIAAVKSEVERLNSDVALYGLMTFEEVRAQQLFPVKALATLSTLFGFLALLLTAVGIYGVVSYAVRRRTREIGVRIALGARKQDILGMILRHALLLGVAGLLAGALIAAGTTRLLSTLLFGVSSLDALTFAVAALLLITVTLLSSLVPATRAAWVDPAVSLRYE